jgi:hypothetical protein
MLSQTRVIYLESAKREYPKFALISLTASELTGLQHEEPLQLHPDEPDVTATFA